MARWLFVAGTVPFVVLGAVHVGLTLWDVVRPRWFTPVDNRVREAMDRTGLGLTRRTSVWRAWLGFNLSHGLGAFVFGLLLLLMGVRDFDVVVALGFVMPLAVAVSAVYVILSVRFWFYAPAIGTGLGAVCFTLAYVVS